MTRTTNNQVEKALRDAGYIPLPRLWVKSEDMPAIRSIALEHAKEVNSLRHQAAHNNETGTASHRQSSNAAGKNPLEDRNVAWEHFELQRIQR